jgi:triacylglycerol esterase/lipase EstA (alpha/beta hydrolase family)
VYGLADYIFAILGFLEAINWLDGKQFNLVGHSMGGRKFLIFNI